MWTGEADYFGDYKRLGPIAKLATSYRFKPVASNNLFLEYYSFPALALPRLDRGSSSAWRVGGTVRIALKHCAASHEVTSGWQRESGWHTPQPPQTLASRSRAWSPTLVL